MKANNSQEIDLMKIPVLRLWLLILGFLCLYPFLNFVAASAATATEEIKSTIDGVLQIVTTESYKDDRKIRRKMIRDLIDKRFSYEQMGMRSLGANWNDISKSEQKEFIKLFSKLLENSYATKIESAKQEKVNYKEEKLKGKYAMVKTEITRNGGPVPVDYKLIRIDSKWKVYDIVIEGVSLIKNYRSQFNRIIHQESYDTLKKKIISRINKIEANKKFSDDL